MAEYINREALLNKIFLIGMPNDGNYGINAKAVKVAIESIPTADVVEVVYCADCKWHTADGCQNPRIDMSDGAKLYMYPSDYCSYGERKGGEE